MTEATQNFNGNFILTIKIVCKKINNITIIRVSDLNLCLDKLTYGENEMITSLANYYLNRTSKPLSVQWKTYIHPRKYYYNNVKIVYKLISVYGKCLFVHNLGFLRESNLFKLYLNNNLSFLVFLHDPNFFYVSQNPESAPSVIIHLNMETDLGSLTRDKLKGLQWIYAVKNIKYNRKASLCVTDTKYSFKSCLIDYIVKSTNCTVSFKYNFGKAPIVILKVQILCLTVEQTCTELPQYSQSVPLDLLY